MDAYARSWRIPAVFQIKTPAAEHAQTKCLYAALKQFPDKGFEVGLSRIPTIGYSQIWKYIIKDVELIFSGETHCKRVQFLHIWKSARIVSSTDQWSALHQKPSDARIF